MSCLAQQYLETVKHDLELVILQQQPGRALRITSHWPLYASAAARLVLCLAVTKSLEEEINGKLVIGYPGIFWKGGLSFAADSLLKVPVVGFLHHL